MFCPICNIGITGQERSIGKCLNCGSTFEAMTFEQWKDRAITYLQSLEKKAKVKNKAWSFVLGDDVDMMEQGYNDYEFYDSPESYVDYQLECAT